MLCVWGNSGAFFWSDTFYNSAVETASCQTKSAQRETKKEIEGGFGIRVFLRVLLTTAEMTSDFLQMVY